MRDGHLRAVADVESALAPRPPGSPPSQSDPSRSAAGRARDPPVSCTLPERRRRHARRYSSSFTVRGQNGTSSRSAGDLCKTDAQADAGRTLGEREQPEYPARIVARQPRRPDGLERPSVPQGEPPGTSVLALPDEQPEILGVEAVLGGGRELLRWGPFDAGVAHERGVRRSLAAWRRACGSRSSRHRCVPDQDPARSPGRSAGRGHRPGRGTKDARDERDPAGVTTGIRPPCQAPGARCRLSKRTAFTSS